MSTGKKVVHSNNYDENRTIYGDYQITKVRNTKEIKEYMNCPSSTLA